MRYDGNKIKNRRLEIDLTQAEVSARAKISIPTISRIENNHKSYVKPCTMEALAIALRADVAALSK